MHKVEESANKDANEITNPLGRNGFKEWHECSNPSHSAKTETLKPQRFRGFLLQLLGFLDIGVNTVIVNLTLWLLI